VVISPSKWLLGYYREKGFFENSKNVVLPNPVAYPNNSNDNLCDKVNRASFVFVGQIERHKGIEFLLALIKDLSDVKLTVVGVGTLLDELRSKYQRFENIKFLGKVNQVDLKEIFEKNAYLIMPTLCYENSPTVIYESFSFGRPVIVANLGGAAELVEAGKTGYVFEAGNKLELEKIIKRAIENKEYSAMSDNCLKKIRGFSIDKYIVDFMKIIVI
jgi:glycosyltransferase involved in cell wall biosynthesis